MARCARARVAQVKERLVRVWAESAAARAPAQARTFTRNVKDATARAVRVRTRKRDRSSRQWRPEARRNCYFVTHGFDLSAPRFHRKTRVFKCLHQPMGAQQARGFIVRSKDDRIYRITKKRVFFVSHRDVEN